MTLTIRESDLLFVVMPWAFPDNPAIGPSLLQRLLEEAGFRSQVLYPGLELITAMGATFYDAMSNDLAYFEVSDHFFSCYVHGKDAVQSDLFFERLQAEKDDLTSILGPDPRKAFTQLRDVIIPDLIEQLARVIAERDIPAVGFSCTFNQVLASLALAKRLKQLKPEVKTLFGGPSFDCEMGLAHHRKYQAIMDHVFLGEADEQIVGIAQRICAKQPLDGIQGLTVFKDGAVRTSTLYCLANGLEVPPPNYDDFYLQRREVEAKGFRLPPVGPLPFESSRGCWWAVKLTCSFCGLNGGRFDFRSKSPSRVVAELEDLSTRYSTLDFRASDNIIDISHFKLLFPKIEQSGLDYSLWYQTRTNLKKDDVVALKHGKVSVIQAGIESFSDNVLKLMRKGVTGLQNIQFLKWCKELGVGVSYFILYGFPGETAEDYDEVAGIVPLIVHLPPPVRMQHIQLHRFSPMYNQPAEFGVDEIYAREYTSFVYPDDVLEKDLLYTFTHYSAQTENAEQYTTCLRAAVDHWITHHYQSRPVLEMRVGKDFLLIHDTRWGDERRYYLNAVQKEIVLLSDAVAARWKIANALLERFPDLDAGAVESEIKVLEESGIVLAHKERVLALPVKPFGTA